jgi:hypothetical protein
MATLTIESYDEILDALDSENTESILELFSTYDLEPHSTLLDTPRICFNDELNTYLDYAIAYNLTNILDLFIDDMNLVIDDEVLARSIYLNTLDTYKYLCDLGYTPEGDTLKATVKMCYSEISDSILADNCELIDVIDEYDIDFLFGEDIDEETVETVRVLLNYNVNHDLFRQHLAELLEMKDKYLEDACDDSAYGDNCNAECDITLEIIDLLSTCDITFE